MIHFTFVQNWIIGIVTSKLSKALHTEVKIDHVDYRFFDKLELKGLLVKDLKKDTLLSAGSAVIDITDWFFLKDKVSVKHFALNDAYVNMHRSDSVWNYQFLVDYFSSPKKKNSKSSGGMEFDIEQVELSNIKFIQRDEWVGNDKIISLKELKLVANVLDLNNKKINLDLLHLIQPEFSQNDYTGNRKKLGIKKRKSAPSTEILPYTWNNDGWVILVKELNIKDGIFNNERETEHAPYTDQFDGQHFQFSGITGSLKNLKFEKDTLTANIQLATKEKSGFEVKNLSAALKFTPKIMEFNQFLLQTDRSTLRNYYSMSYNDFEDDMSDFISKVNLNANFENSTLNSDDLVYFAPELRTWKKIFSINGIAKGTIDNLTAKKMLIKTGNSLVDGSITLKGLPDIDNTFIDFKSNQFQTNYKELTDIIPSLKNVTQPNLAKLGNISYVGNFTGFINDFVAFGVINTNLGLVTGDINMKLPDGKPAQYLGKLSTSNFQLGTFINNQQIGNATFDGIVKGSGFKSSDIALNLDGNIKKLGFNGYDYQQINISGDFKKNVFTGLASIDDPNVKIKNFKGIIKLDGKVPEFNFDADIIEASLKPIGLTLDDFKLSGHVNLDFKGSNIDNFLGAARVYDA
ncbi:MAG: hypothetical protein ACOYKE_01755, partial [Ferruginibacter sp.]